MPLNLKRFLAILSLQVASWWLLFSLGGAIWWDDWVLHSLPRPELKNYFLEIGRPFFYPIHRVLLDLGPLAYPITTFVVSLAISWVFYLLLKLKFDERRAFVAACLLAAAPMTTTRVLSIFEPFMLGLLTFFIGWYIMLRRGDRFGYGWQVLTFGLFFWSYTTSSLLVWVLIPIASHFVSIYSEFSVANLWNYAKRTWLILVSPVVFWLVDRTFFSPFGHYKNYNNPTYFLHHGKSLVEVVAICIAIVIASIYLVRRFNAQKSGTLDLGVFAGVSILLGSLPYLMIGRSPSHFYGFQDRFCLLYTYGLVVALALLIETLAAKRAVIGKTLFALSLAAFVAMTNMALSSYYLDNKVQNQIIAEMTNQPIFRYSSTVVFDNKAKWLFAYHRNSPDYEYSGWLNRATGDRMHYGLKLGELKTYLNYRYWETLPKYAAKDYVPGKGAVLVRIKAKSGEGWPQSIFSSEPSVTVTFQKIADIHSLVN